MRMGEFFHSKHFFFFFFSGGGGGGGLSIIWGKGGCQFLVDVKLALF